MPNLTLNQKLALTGLLLGLLAGGGSTLTELFGTGMAAKIAAAAGFLNSFVNGAILILTGQGNIVKEVAAMPGVTRVSVNSDANPTLAAVALDPAQLKVGATTPDVREALKDTVKGTQA